MTIPGHSYEHHLAEIEELHPAMPAAEREALARHRFDTHPGFSDEKTGHITPVVAMDLSAIRTAVSGGLAEALRGYTPQPVIVREPAEPQPVVYVDKPVIVERWHEPTVMEIEKQVVVFDPKTVVHEVTREIVVKEPGAIQYVDKPVIVERWHEPQIVVKEVLVHDEGKLVLKEIERVIEKPVNVFVDRAVETAAVDKYRTAYRYAVLIAILFDLLGHFVR